MIDLHKWPRLFAFRHPAGFIRPESNAVKEKNAGKLECWNAGMLGCWDAGMLGRWDAGTLESYMQGSGSFSWLV